MKKDNSFFRYVKKMAALRINSRFLSGILHRIDKPFIYLSGGRTSLSSILTGIPVVVLTTIGAKSGLKRRLPLFSLIDEEKFILIASSFGREKNPGWYYNLLAHPQANLVYKGKSGEYLAREAKGEERDCYWQQATQLYQGYSHYAQWASHRKIPVIILEPINNK